MPVKAKNPKLIESPEIPFGDYLLNVGISQRVERGKIETRLGGTLTPCRTLPDGTVEAYEITSQMVNISIPGTVEELKKKDAALKAFAEAIESAVQAYIDAKGL